MRRVGCLSAPDNIDILRATRDTEMTHAYYGQYQKAGVLGILDNATTLRFSA